MIDRAREIALRTLYKIDRQEAYSNIILDEEIKTHRKLLKPKDISLISQIVYGTTNWKLTIDTLILKFSNVKLKKISPWILNILRMGIYQIIFLDKIPKSAAVNECVTLAKRYGHQKSAGFVNAILRKVKKQDYEELYKIDNVKTRISKTQSMPIWIIEELLKGYNIEQVEEICRQLNNKACISIRVNKLKINREELIKKLEKYNISCKLGELEDFIIVENIKNIEEIEEFKKGYFTIQDQSAGLAVVMLDPQEGENVLDACCAPGGKTTYIAEKMKNNGKIDAWDIYEHRLKLVERNCNRLNISIVETNKNDASTFNPEKEVLYDRILLDVPCLGIGVIKRKPDIKWKKNFEDVKKITKTQLEILQNCSKFVKKGGTIVYSTCSILEEENQNIIETFLDTNEEFENVTLQNISQDDKILKHVKNGKFLEILPNKEYDGFFICVLKRKY